MSPGVMESRAEAERSSQQQHSLARAGAGVAQCFTFRFMFGRSVHLNSFGKKFSRTVVTERENNAYPPLSIM